MMTMAMMVDTVHREFAVHSKMLSRCFSCHPQRTVAASHCDPSQEDKDLCTTIGVPLEEEVSTKDLSSVLREDILVFLHHYFSILKCRF